MTRKMRRWMAAVALATLAAGTTSSALAQAPAVAGPAIEIEPKAPAILKGTSDRLAAAKTLAFKATVSEKSPSRLGPVLACTSRYDVVLQRPDKLRVTSPGDGAATDLPYNGKLLAAYAPATNLIATMPAPATIDAALLQGFKTASIYPPFTDLVVADPCKAIADGLRVAFYVGQATTVGGTTTDILVFGNDDVLIERWVGAQDRLPRTMRAVHLGDRQKVQHEMVLEELLAVLREALMTQGFLADEVESDRPQPLPEVRPGAEVVDVPVGEDKGLVGDLVDEVRHGQLHRDKSTQVRAMQLEEPLEGGKIPPLHADDEIFFCWGFAHYREYPVDPLS